MSITLLYTKWAIDSRVREMAIAIDRQYPEGVTLVMAMTGAMFFVVDLTRYMRVPVRIEIVVVNSYHGKTMMAGRVRIKYAQIPHIDGDAVVVDDVLDTGQTMRHLVSITAGASPRSIRTMTLLRKRNTYPVDWVGFDVDPHHFVIGYGLDYDGLYRNRNYIGAYHAE